MASPNPKPHRPAVYAEVTAVALLVAFWLVVWWPGVLPTVAAFLLLYANASAEPVRKPR